MNIKGTAYVAGKLSLIENFGQESWNSFLVKLSAKDNYFSTIIMNVTLIPLDNFVIFLDEILKEFFNNDDKVYWMFGMVNAKFALSEGGPYHVYMLTKDMKQLVEVGIPQLWSTYFDGGKIEAKFENNVVHIKITELPAKHIYFEYLVMGYVYEGIRVLGKKAAVKRIRSFSSGDKDIYYQFEIKES